MLAYYRSQHPNQSWLGALTVVVDVSALAMLGADGDLKRQAEFTFAAGRHALVHIASVFRAHPHGPHADRLSSEDFSRLRDAISTGNTPLRSERISEPELRKLRTTYEPYARALGAYLLMAVPHWVRSERMSENWRVASWEKPEAPFVVSDPFKHKR
jgi:hypothetical protein